MKTTTFKKVALMLLCLPLFALNANAAIDHGSVKGTGLPFYAQYNAGTLDPLTERAGVTFDFKVVTIGSKTWGWTNTTGATVGGATWASQLRYWNMANNAKTENNLLFRVASTQQTYGSTTATIPANVQLSFFQDIAPGGMSETARVVYDKTAKNSADVSDVTAPTLTSVTVSGVTETTADLNITGSDNSGDVFYHITNGTITEVSFLPTITISGLTQLTNYTFTVTAIDFSGNESVPQNVNFTTGGLVQVTSGIAKDIKFVLKSTGTKLEYYYEFTNPVNKFRDAFLKITPAGGTEFEIKPTISPDSTYAYGVIDNDSRTNNKILTLNCGYMIYKMPLDWAEYVVDNKLITSGTLNGTPIKHQMGGGVSLAEVETVVPVITSVTQVDATANYIKLNISGSDNSGTVYYTITGAKSTVNAFRTGSYYLTSIDPGKVYNLSVKPYDLNGNTAAAQTITVKTMPARTNIKDSTNLNYNTIVLPTAPAGELTTIIQQSGNTLTLGCTTKSLLLPTGNRNRVFNTPTVKIDNVSYPLTLDADGTTAVATFNSPIGTKEIAVGTSFTVQWSVFWGATGGGNFFTGVFTYTIGDAGQVDVTGPSTPVLTLSGSDLTWPACVDDLSGVKSYLVSETGQTPVTIFDLGDTSYSYTMVNPAAVVTVKSVDFVGNQSLAASKNDTGTALDELTNTVLVYPNPASDRIYFSAKVAQASLYTLQGQHILSARNAESLNVSTLSKGLYIVRLTNQSGVQKSIKIEIR
jgi:hypothetical protein